MNQIQAMTRTILDSGYTETQVASLINVSQPTVNNIKSGYVKYPTYETCMKIEALHKKVVARNKRLAKAGNA